jgi:hypothetical protein
MALVEGLDEWVEADRDEKRHEYEDQSAADRVDGEPDRDGYKDAEGGRKPDDERAPPVEGAPKPAELAVSVGLFVRAVAERGGYNHARRLRVA